MRCVAITVVALAAIGGRGASPSSGGIAVNGAMIPRATSTTSTSVDITEFREGGEPCPRLLADCKHYGVCINSPTPIAALDAVLPQSAASTRFSVGVEDGRQFSQCLLSTVNTANTNGGPGFDRYENATRPYTYCFKCEDVAVPAGGP